MNTSSLSMSGLVSLSTAHTEFLSLFDIEVPVMMTVAQLEALVAQADFAVARMVSDPHTHPMISKMTQKTLDELKAEFGFGMV